MRISSVTLKNVCQHQERSIELSPGMNLFTGPNGSGKSNALKAIYAALTNDWSRNEGQKEKNVNALAVARAPAGVTLTFEHGGATYRISRQLQPSKQELIVPDEEKPITRDALINARVAQVLGVSAEILDHYVFVDQWAMFDFLVATDTERAKAFQRLFGTQEAEKAWDAVGEALNGIEVPQVGADLDGQQSGLRQAQAAVEDLERRLALFHDLPESTAADPADAQALRDYDRRQTLVRDEVRLSRLVRSLSEEIASLAPERQAFAGDRDSLLAAQSGSQESVHAARAAIANWKTLQSVQASRTRITGQLDRLGQEMLAVPMQPIDYVSDLDVEFNNRYDFLAGEIRRAETFIRSFDPKSGKAECPTCFTPVATLLPAVEEAKKALPLLKAEQVEKKDKIDRSRRYDRELIDFTREKADRDRRKADLQRQLSELMVIDRPERSEAELNQVVTDFTELERTLRDVEREVAAIDNQVSVLQGRLQSERTMLQSVTAELQALRMVSPEDADAIRLRMAERTVRFQERAMYRGGLSSEQRNVRAYRESIQQLEDQRAAGERTRNWVRHLNEVRAVLHRNSLPKIVAQHYLRELEVDTNEFLSVFDAPFRVEADEKLSFQALFHDGKVQPAGRLSGGEKVVLALAFRLSVNSMFAQDVGLLCLDEPTVGLDAHNLGCLRTALERLKDLTRSRGLQVIMVTHEASLGPLFDRVIDMGAPA